MFGWFISAPLFGAEQRDRIAAMPAVEGDIAPDNGPSHEESGREGKGEGIGNVLTTHGRTVRVRFYNERRHSGVGYRTPAQVHAEMLMKAAA
jgi:hypothetical protein